MDKASSEIDWSQLSKPLSSNLFDKYTHQSILPPLTSLNINEITWNECRSFALNLGKKGFHDPLAILYTSFKRLYPNCPSIRSFTRWLILYEKDNNDFKNYFKQYSIHSLNIQSIGELIRLIQTLEINENISKIDENFDQIWFLFSISIRIPINDYAIIADNLILDDGATRLSIKHKKTTSRLHCLFALTPSGKFSNQLIICKQGKQLKIDFQSSTFTRIIQTTTGDITYEHIQQWLEDFNSLSYEKKHSAILIDPRTTLLIPECEKFHINFITINLNYYLIHILTPILTLFDKQCREINRLEKMFLKSTNDLKRIIFTIWCSLRTLKQNEQIYQIFQDSFLWRKQDDLYRQTLRTTIPITLPKKKKKKSPIKTGTKVKLSTSTMMIDPPNESTPEQILSYVIQRQLSISRASKYLGGIKLDYLKYCLSYKSNTSLMTGKRLIELNNFMQSQSTVNWLRYLHSLYYWPCAKQLFLREIYQLTGIITRKRTMNICGNNNTGSIRSCDLQSPGSFWKAFENIHKIQFDNETIIDNNQWNDDFQQYLIDNKLNHDQTQLWTIDTFEFPLTKKSTVLQLPEWNELRPMNLTPKVTIIYAFSNTGQSIEPYFIFPTSFYDHTIRDENNSYNELGHLTSEIFLFWIKNFFQQKNFQSTIILIFDSRLPILSPNVLSYLKTSKIYPYGYPYIRTLPFRYVFERRVRNNRSTNLISELWKKKLFDEQHTHLLKGINCTIKNIKYYFQQIWFEIIHDNHEYKTFKNKCQQAFQQANIEINQLKLISKTINHNEIVNQLNHLITNIHQFKEQIISTNFIQILKMNNNHIQQTQLSLTLNETNNSIENIIHQPLTSIESHSSSNLISITTNDKRSIDENDQQSYQSKRLRSLYSPSNLPIIHSWIPPSKQLITNLQIQSTSLFQFILALINIIYSSIDDDHFTDEHIQWLHSVLNSYDHNYNSDKINLLIETACIVTKINLIR